MRLTDNHETPFADFYKNWQYALKALKILGKSGVENCVDNVYNFL